MKLEEQVITAQQAEKIYNLGLRDESCFQRSIFDSQPSSVVSSEFPKAIGYEDRYNAYTASELMEMFPPTLLLEGDDYDGKIKCTLSVFKNMTESMYGVMYMGDDGEYHEITFNTEIYKNNLAHALGDMLIYLLENNLLPTTTEGA